MWAWSRDRSRLAGVSAGVAVLGGPLSAVVLLALALVPGRDGGAGRDARRRLLVAALGTAAAVAVVVALTEVGTPSGRDAGWLGSHGGWWPGSTGGWPGWGVEWVGPDAGPGSPWFLLTLAGYRAADGRVAALVALGGLLAVALAVVLSRRRPRPSVGAVALVGLTAALCTAASFPPYASLWLVPFVALCGIRWRDHLWWAGAEAVHAVALYGYLASAADPSHGLPAGWYAVALVLRLAAVARLGVRAWEGASWDGAVAAGTLWRLPSVRPVDNPRAVSAAMHTLLSRRDRDRHRPKEAG